MTVEKKVRWGVLGAGRIAHTFCKDIQHSQFAELTAVASRTKSAAQQFADKYKTPEILEAVSYTHLTLPTICSV